MARTDTEPRKKAGGTGKKGKVFMEDKSQLLSMMNDIADTKTAAIKAKIDKARGPDAVEPKAAKGPPGGKGSQGKAAGKKVQTSGDKKRQDKAKALDDAKRVIMAREKEKRDRKKARKAGSSADAAAPAGKEVKVKKRVGFA